MPEGGKEQSCDLCDGDLEGLRSEHSGVCRDCVSQVDAELSEAIVRRSRVVTEDGNPAIEIPGGARFELRTIVKEWDYDTPRYGSDVPMRTEVESDDFAWWSLCPERSDRLTGRDAFPNVVIEPDVHAPEDEEEPPELRTDGGAERTRVGHCKADATDVYAGRGQTQRDMLDMSPGARGWLGNPFSTEDYTRSESIRRFRQVFEWRLKADEEFREAVRDLAGQTLGCWCQRLDEDSPACHAEVIADHADRLASENADEKCAVHTETPHSQGEDHAE